MIIPSHSENDSKSWYSFSGLSSVLNEIALVEKPAILDLGAMAPSFFSLLCAQKCLLYSEGLSDVFHSNPDISFDELDQFIDRHLLHYEQHCKFDAIFSWDLLNYIPLASIEKLLDKILPHCKPNTLLHMIKYTGSRIPKAPCQFIIEDAQHFCTDTALVERKIPVHSTYQLLKTMSKFVILNDLKSQSMKKHFIEHMLCFTPNSNVRKRFTANDDKDSGLALVSQGVSHRSPGIQALCHHLRTLQHPNILDLGYKESKNVELFSTLCKHVYVEELYSSLMNWKKVHGSDADGSFSENVLNFESSTRFDAIILWDLLNYVSPEQVDMLVRRLARYCHEGTRIFVIVYSFDDIPVKPQRFILQSDQQMTIIPANTAPRTLAYRTMAQLFRQLSGFKPDGAYWLQQGMQSGVGEYLLSYHSRL